MRRLISLLAALLLLVYLMWGRPAQSEMPAATPSTAIPDIEMAPPLTGELRSPQVDREEIAEDPEEDFFEGYEELTEADLEPVERGDCTLHLRVFDAHTSKPAHCSIQLWRLDVAASEAWSAGDQLQDFGEDQRGVFRFTRLPQGEFRVYCLSARRGATSPAAFRVEGANTSLDLFVDMPQEHRMVLHLYRPDGYLMTSTETRILEMRDRGIGTTVLGDPVPEWVRERFPLGPYFVSSESFGSGSMTGHHRSWKSLPSPSDGIFLGTWEEDGRMAESKLKRAFRVDGGFPMTVLIQPSGYTAYAAVFLDPADLQEKLIFPDGDLPQDLTGEFDVSAEAVPLGKREGLVNAPPEISEQDWWDVPVRILLDSKEYEKVDFTWRASEGPLPPIRLKRRPPPASE